jgi:Protein of unknown function (DUF1566)
MNDRIANACAAALWSSLCTLPAAPAAARGLNDTGITQCVDATNQFTAVCGGTAQDGEFGRDVSDNKAGNGVAGFSFRRVCRSGDIAGQGTCPATPRLGTGPKRWGCTMDRLTGLLWEIKTNDGGLRDMDRFYTFLAPGSTGFGSATDAEGYVNAVNAAGLCGHADWRLPRAGELQSLMRYDTVYPQDIAIDTGFFPNTPKIPSTGYNWAGDAWALSPDTFAWAGRFDTGALFAQSRASRAHIRLVRSASSPTRQLVVSADGQEVTDRLNRLVWRRCAEGQTLDVTGSRCLGRATRFVWRDALAQAQAAGSGWRLPNIKELASLSDLALVDPAIDTLAFPDVPNGDAHWSASPFTANPALAWTVSVHDGQTHQAGFGVVRLVRDAPCPPKRSKC